MTLDYPTASQLRRHHPAGLRPVAAYRLFFPAAALMAILLVPLSALQFAGLWPAPHPLAGAPAHAHEMLFGFVPAVIAGFLAHRVRRLHLWVLFSLWVGARLSFWSLPLVYSAVLTSAFGAGLAWVVIPPFWRAAKKWRNRLLVPVLLAITLAPGVFYGAGAMGYPALQWRSLEWLLLLMAYLMLFMGGRMIAPAVAGHLQVQGIQLRARVQPRLEAVLLVVSLAAIVLTILPGAQVLAGAVLLLAAPLVGVRLLRWRLWHCAGRVDLLGLGLGYAWLAVSLGLLGAHHVGADIPRAGAIHGLTVGALGTLSLTVMARTWVIKSKRHPGQIPGLAPAVAMITLAAVLRVFVPFYPLAWGVAAIGWAGAFGCLVWSFWRTR